VMRLLLLLVLLSVPAWAKPPDFSGVEWADRTGAPLPTALPLQDADGRTTTLAAIGNGLPLILAPGYFHCPSLCSVVRDDLLGALAASRLRPGRDVEVAVVSIDPAETPADAADAKGAGDSRWPGAHYLTGDSSALQQAAGFHARYDSMLKQFLHPAGLVTVTPDGRVGGYVGGVGYTPAQLEDAVAAVRAGRVERASLIRLLCFHFDPSTGRYTVAVERLVQAASLFTALLIGAWLWRAHRSGTRHRGAP
jgi:protein SCO1